jgi:hypothetical protein
LNIPQITASSQQVGCYPAELHDHVRSTQHVYSNPPACVCCVCSNGPRHRVHLVEEREDGLV